MSTINYDEIKLSLTLGKDITMEMIKSKPFESLITIEDFIYEYIPLETSIKLLGMKQGTLEKNPLDIFMEFTTKEEQENFIPSLKYSYWMNHLSTKYYSPDDDINFVFERNNDFHDVVFQS